jgi:hypothetical protein
MTKRELKCTRMAVRAVLASLLAVSQRNARAQQSPCDQIVLRLRDSSRLAYRPIGERCEGTFANPTSGTGDIILGSITSSFPNLNFSSFSRLILSWPSLNGADVTVRATSMRFKYYYQMDSHPATAKSFTWPMELLAQTPLLRPEVGILAWTERAFSGLKQDIYLPVEVQALGLESASSDSVEVVVVPTVELSEVYRRVALCSVDGKEQSVLVPKSPLNYGSYPAHVPISLLIKLGRMSGMFNLNLIATATGGGTLQRSYWIYVGRPQ